MYLFVEAWTPRAAWLALSVEERTAYLERTGAEIAALEDRGIRSLGTAFTDDASAGGYVAFAVWDCGSRAGCDVLRAAIADAGWYDLFDQLDFGGKSGPIDAVLGHHVGLPVQAPAEG